MSKIDLLKSSNTSSHSLTMKFLGDYGFPLQEVHLVSAWTFEQLAELLEAAPQCFKKMKKDFNEASLLLLQSGSDFVS